MLEDKLTLLAKAVRDAVAKHAVQTWRRARVELFLREKIEGPCNLYTVSALLTEFDDRNFGENAVRRTLLQLKCSKAYNGDQLKLNGKTVRLWILAEGDQRDRLLAIKEPSHLAEEWNREREQTRSHGRTGRKNR